MFKIEGLDELQKELAQAERALKELDGEIGQVNFDPDDPGSIDGAIASAEQMIDERLGRYANNKLVAPMIDAAKEEFRKAILEEAERARLEADDD